jgi:hypothetical protein
MITLIVNFILAFLGLTPAYIPSTYIAQASYRVLSEPDATLNTKAALYLKHLERARKRKGYTPMQYSYEIIGQWIVIKLTPGREYLAYIQRWLGGCVQGNQVVYALAV